MSKNKKTYTNTDNAAEQLHDIGNKIYSIALKGLKNGLTADDIEQIGHLAVDIQRLSRMI